MVAQHGGPVCQYGICMCRYEVYVCLYRVCAMCAGMGSMCASPPLLPLTSHPSQLVRVVANISVDPELGPVVADNNGIISLLLDTLSESLVKCAVCATLCSSVLPGSSAHCPPSCCLGQGLSHLPCPPPSPPSLPPSLPLRASLPQCTGHSHQPLLLCGPRLSAPAASRRHHCW